MPSFPIVDSHVHLANPQRFDYAWTKNAPSLNRLVLPEHLTTAAAPVEIEQFVFVEVDVDFPQHLDEAAWVQEVSHTDPRLTGMVASLPLEKGKAAEPELQRLCENSILRGIRRLIQTQPDADFCLRPSFIEGLKLLPQYDLAFDICVFHNHLPNVIKMVRECPAVRFVLDHIGKPPIKAGEFEPWRADMKALASLPNVVCKISGVSTEADHKDWTREQLRPYIAHALDVFGFDRCMYGGDWHVLELAGTYPDWVDIVDWVVADATHDEQRWLFRDTAIATYRLTQ